MDNTKFVKFAGLLGIATPVFGLSAVFASTLLCGVGCGEGSQAAFPWGSEGSFSWTSNALSDLGVSKVANIFNYSLILVGVLNFIFAVGFVKAYVKGVLLYLGGIVLILGGGSLSLVGVFTEAYGSLHGYVSLGYFVLFPIAMILVGFGFSRAGLRIRGYLSVFPGIIALAVILSGVQWHTWLGLGFAVPEIVETLLIAGWIIWTGGGLLRSSTSVMRK